SENWRRKSGDRRVGFSGGTRRLAMSSWMRLDRLSPALQNALQTSVSMQTKLMVVLANSVKSSGRCLAGKEVFDSGKSWKIGGWIRPVTTQEGGEISAYQMSQALGSDPKLLEVIEIPFSGAVPLSYQPENWLIETPLKKGSWKSHGMIDWDQAPTLLDQ